MTKIERNKEGGRDRAIEEGRERVREGEEDRLGRKRLEDGGRER